jgi:hypothetical protein
VRVGAPANSQNYVQPTIRADRGWLHLKARYNYEALDIGSAWVGYNFSVDEKLPVRSGRRRPNIRFVCEREF